MEDNSKDHPVMDQKRGARTAVLIGVLVALVVIFVGVAGLHERRTAVRPYQHSFARGQYRTMQRGKVGHPYSLGQIFGSISQLNGNTLTLHTTSKDYSVTIASTTSIYASDKTVAKQADLKVSDPVVVIGTPDSNGIITATTILMQ